MFEDDSLTKKYFEVKANLRQNLMMEVGFGFGDENDDEQEKEEEFTNSNVTKNDAIVERDCDCGQQEETCEESEPRENDMNSSDEKPHCSHNRIFNHRVQELIRFKEANGHFDVPNCGDTLMPLGIWCRAVKKKISDIEDGRSICTSEPVATLGTEMNL